MSLKTSFATQPHGRAKAHSRRTYETSIRHLYRLDIGPLSFRLSCHFPSISPFNAALGPKCRRFQAFAPLCRLYEKGLGSVSNSYAIASTFRAAQRPRRNLMGVTATEPRRRTTRRAGKSRSFWQRLSQALDRFVVGRSQHLVPATVLRRSKHDLDRCRRLMPKESISLVPVTAKRIPARRIAARTRP